MDQHQRDEWEALVKSAFPSNVEVTVTPGTDDFEARVSWPLPTADRPYKRSKTIRLVITMEAIRGSSTKPSERREQDRQKVVTWIRNKLESFDPNHDVYVSPEVKWAIRTDLLNS